MTYEWHIIIVDDTGNFMQISRAHTRECGKSASRSLKQKLIMFGTIMRRSSLNSIICIQICRFRCGAVSITMCDCVEYINSVILIAAVECEVWGIRLDVYGRWRRARRRVSQVGHEQQHGQQQERRTAHAQPGRLGEDALPWNETVLNEWLDKTFQKMIKMVWHRRIIIKKKEDEENVTSQV